MSTPIRLAVHGAAGRMGRRVIALASQDDSIDLMAAVEHKNHASIGKDAGELSGVGAIGVPLSSDWPEQADAVIDFSLPDAIDDCIQHCEASGFPLVVATTGLSDAQRARIKTAGHTIPVVWAPSMSLAVNLTMRLAQQVTTKLKDVSGGVDIEIIERHHRYKADAPSGTALKFGDLISEAMSGAKSVHGREGHTGQRSRDEIGYHAVRVGDNPGEHTIVFGMLGETLELKVSASNRDCYASGSLAAARWLQDRASGLYDMWDVLHLRSS